MGISLFDNEDEPKFRGQVLPDQPEFSVIFYKLFFYKLIGVGMLLFLLSIFGKCTPGKYCNDC